VPNGECPNQKVLPTTIPLLWALGTGHSAFTPPCPVGIMLPHAGQPILTAGPPPEASRAAMIMLHGRNAGPRNILELAGPLHHPDFCYLAPAAASNTWYPYSFLAEIQENEPGISSGLYVVDQLVQRLMQAGIAKHRVWLLGFSQGACLASTYAVRHADRFGGVIVLSGGLIGPPSTSWDYPGDFAETPVFLGCSETDPHIPKARVEESAAVFTRMGASVTQRLYPRMGHLVNDDEVESVRGLMAGT